MTDWLKRLFGVQQKPPSENVEPVLRRPLSETEKEIVEKAVKRTVKEYGEALTRMGNE